MRDSMWEIAHFVETDATREFTWAFMSNVANWNDPPARFQIDGPFVTGARGTTQMPDQPPQQWQLVDVTAMESYTVEFPLDRAVLSFTWTFHPLSDRTRLTQRVSLRGANAAAYLATVQQTFSANLAPGMERIAAAIDRANASGKQT
jgi:hypothetical protein